MDTATGAAWLGVAEISALGEDLCSFAVPNFLYVNCVYIESFLKYVGVET